MFTSYYANVSKLPKELKPIGISRKVPEFFYGPTLRKLAPTWLMLKMPPENYATHYARILSQLDPRAIYEELGGEGAVMLCYESPTKNCHRRAVAEWLQAHLGIDVPEYGVEKSMTLTYWDRFPWVTPPFDRVSSNS